MAQDWSELIAEIARWTAEMEDLARMPSREAYQWLSSISARSLLLLTSLIGDPARGPTKVRVEHLIPFREECRFQFTVLSRMQSVQRDEWEMAKGQM